MRTAISFLCPICFLAILATSSFGRRIESWPYERLFKEADLVVIATADGTAQTKDEFSDHGWDVTFIGQQSTFSVKTTLKGNLKEKETFEVLHYRLPKISGIEDGPMLVSFRNETLSLKGTIHGTAFTATLGQPDYLLFLRVRPDGRYEFVSGQIDPMLSVRELNSPDGLFSELSRKD